MPNSRRSNRSPWGIAARSPRPAAVRWLCWAMACRATAARCGLNPRQQPSRPRNRRPGPDLPASLRCGSSQSAASAPDPAGVAGAPARPPFPPDAPPARGGPPASRPRRVPGVSSSPGGERQRHPHHDGGSPCPSPPPATGGRVAFAAPDRAPPSDSASCGRPASSPGSPAVGGLSARPSGPDAGGMWAAWRGSGHLYPQEFPGDHRSLTGGFPNRRTSGIPNHRQLVRTPENK